MADNSKKNALLYTKLQRPPVAPDIVRRSRLLSLLEEGRQRPLTLISAPAGYGKSTLASRWAAACDWRVAWLSLDGEDDDLRQFLTYFLAAVQEAFPEYRFNTEVLLDAGQLPSGTVLARYLLNDFNGLPEPLGLVLDDYHYITEPLIHEVVSALLKHPARPLSLVVLSRSEPPLPVATMRGRGLVTEIGASDLRLTMAEAAAFMERLLSAGVDESTVSILEAKTEGWAAGLRLAGLYLDGRSKPREDAQKLGGGTLHIAKYLLAEVVSNLDSDTIFYLHETAILDRFCAPLCWYMHQQRFTSQGRENAEAFIEGLVENNLFTLALDGEGYWFRYHHLFRDFLNGMLEKDVSSEEIFALHRAAGNWFAENNLLEEAVHHLLASGDISGAVALVVGKRHDLLNSSQIIRLDRLLGMLPESACAKDPLVATTRAFICIEQGNYAGAQGWMDEAEDRLEGHLQGLGAHIELTSEVRVLHNLMGLFTASADRSRFYARDAFGELPAQAIFIKAYEVGISACFYQMRREQRQVDFVIKEALANPKWPANIQARIYFHLCIALYMNGDLPGVMRTVSACRRFVGDASFHHTRAYAHYFQGVASYLQNDLKEAETDLLNVLDARHTANASYVAEAGFILSCIYLSGGDETAAQLVREQIITHCRRNGHERIASIALGFEAETEVRQGNLEKARRISAHTDFNGRPPLWFFYVPQLTPIKCLMAEATQESLDQAYTRLRELEGRMHSINRVNVYIEVSALLALVCHMQGDGVAAKGYMTVALDLAEPGGWIRSFVDLGPSMTALLTCFVSDHNEHFFGQQVLAACLESGTVGEASARSSAIRKQAFVQGPVNLLTQRETEIVPLLAEGMSNKEIAEILNVSEGTVKTHLKNIFRKLGANSRIDALNRARELGLFIVT
ncbi:LuxR C-terminal-related transcriptional regulator [Desulfoluna spongiiphila]|uniref:LuxR family transcriptional regulator, maltose regulon positive regulatory protein n=1 Tax=Desulfoluna spongiiphila TaxID=419481 RepID=A0A1G5DV52_9BACT|nr:LuxR C-terminal-related transcriptional regulator [Desulfoluna spongiiphila]SCY18679.1 LuxR family transcriptional regulator, maltose regulon positive regulatory protein [Desulfoluna spongiiphila]